MALLRPENRSLSPEAAACIEANRRSDRRVALLMAAPVFLLMLLLAFCTQLHGRAPATGLSLRRLAAGVTHRPMKPAAMAVGS